jgi:hypothetical protein
MSDPTPSEIEQQRRDALARLKGAIHAGVPLEEAFAPGTLGCHEALHTASVLLAMLEQHLMDHPAIAAQPAWYASASRAHRHLYELYQAIGADHLSAAQASGR